MLIADVNVFVGAHRAAHPDHTGMLDWLDRHLDGDEVFGVDDLALSGFVRIVTNFRVFADPTPPDVALEFCEAVRTSPAATVVSPGARHWEIFAGLVHGTQARANTVPDAYLAALALANRATFVTRDRGFARFPGLRTVDPLAP